MERFSLCPALLPAGKRKKSRAGTARPKCRHRQIQGHSQTLGLYPRPHIGFRRVQTDLSGAYLTYLLKEHHSALCAGTRTPFRLKRTPFEAHTEEMVDYSVCFFCLILQFKQELWFNVNII